MKDGRDKARIVLLRNSPFVMFYLDDRGEVDTLEHGKADDVRMIAAEVLSAAERFLEDNRKPKQEETEQEQGPNTEVN